VVARSTSGGSGGGVKTSVIAQTSDAIVSLTLHI